jgi:hypothetical protein
LRHIDWLIDRLNACSSNGLSSDIERLIERHIEGLNERLIERLI